MSPPPEAVSANLTVSRLVLPEVAVQVNVLALLRRAAMAAAEVPEAYRGLNGEQGSGELEVLCPEGRKQIRMDRTQHVSM